MRTQMHFLKATHACLYDKIEEKVRTCYTSGCLCCHVALHYTRLHFTVQTLSGHVWKQLTTQTGGDFMVTCQFKNIFFSVKPTFLFQAKSLQQLQIVTCCCPTKGNTRQKHTIILCSCTLVHCTVRREQRTTAGRGRVLAAKVRQRLTSSSRAAGRSSRGGRWPHQRGRRRGQRGVGAGRRSWCLLVRSPMATGQL